MKWFGILVELVGAAYKAIKERINQRDRNKLEANPAEWFDDHFGGVSNESSNSKTNEADTSNSETK